MPSSLLRVTCLLCRLNPARIDFVNRGARSEHRQDPTRYSTHRQDPTRPFPKIFDFQLLFPENSRCPTVFSPLRFRLYSRLCKGQK